jgi:hypothetical protein
MDVLIIGLIKFWTVSWLISVVLILFRTDSTAMFLEIFKNILKPNIFSFIVSLVIIYVLLPFTIPYSISNIIKGSQ